MAQKSLLAARREAAAETLARIRRDGEGKPWQVRAFLDHLCEDDRLFAEGLRVADVRRACGIPKGSFASDFRRATDELPSDYLRHRRLEVAARLLRRTDFPVARIAETVGYRQANWFSHAFAAWADETPSDYRRRYRAGAGPPVPVHDPLFLERAFSGGLERQEAELYILYLRELYAVAPADPAAAAAPDPEFWDEVMAQAVWRRLTQEPPEEHQRIVRCQYGFRTPALFELLFEESHRESDPRRRLRLAELALASLEALAPGFGPRLTDLKARAWAWIGNARRLALDFAAAQRALDRAEMLWHVPRPEPEPDRRVLAEIYLYQGMLRYFQRRFEEALALNARALEILRELDEGDLLAQTLIARAAIKGSSGKPEDTFTELQEASAIITELDQPRLMLIASVALASSYALAGLTREARGLLPRARELVEELDHRSLGFNIVWVEGLVEKAEGNAKTAERLFRRAHQGFGELDEIDYAAVVGLALAELLVERGRSEEALALAAATIPAFERFAIRREAIAALRLIREALEQQTLPRAVLRKIRASMEALRKDPCFGLKARDQSLGSGSDPIL